MYKQYRARCKSRSGCGDSCGGDGRESGVLAVLVAVATSSGVASVEVIIVPINYTSLNYTALICCVRTFLRLEQCVSQFSIDMCHTHCRPVGTTQYKYWYLERERERESRNWNRTNINISTTRRIIMNNNGNNKFYSLLR